jgi:hypothetical protein
VFGVQDLFVAGLSLDIVGAWLVARGLLASPYELALRTASLWNGNPATTWAQIEDRIRGLIGVTALLPGFLVQAAGYSLVVLLDAPSKGDAWGLIGAGLLPALSVSTFTLRRHPPIEPAACGSRGALRRKWSSDEGPARTADVGAVG